MRNQELSQIFQDFAKILEIKGDNPFRIRAYERASQNIASLSEDIDRLAREEKLRQIPGIGEDLQNKINEFLKTGKIRAFQELKKSLPAGLLELISIPSVGPKTAKLLFERLDIKDIAGLEKAIRKNKLDGIFGIKEKTIANMVQGIALVKKGKERMTLFQAMQTNDEFVQGLKAAEAAQAISCAGSLRRRKETVRDIDILVISKYPQKIMDKFVSLPAVKKIIARGPTKSSILTRDNVQIDCRVVKKKSFGAALVYFTGSKNFNIKLRQLALRKGLKINEYGVFRNDKFIGGQTEEEVFKALGLNEKKIDAYFRE